jgi:hypothetical protein
VEFTICHSLYRKRPTFTLAFHPAFAKILWHKKAAMRAFILFAASAWSMRNVSAYQDVQTALGQQKSVESERNVQKPCGDLIDIVDTLSGVKLVWIEKNFVPYGYRTDRQV